MNTSPLEKIHAAIKSFNPFETLAIVREQNIWDGGFPDVPTFNAHASDEVIKAIKQVQQTSTGHSKITSRVIVSGQGEGKSHIISRIFNHCRSTEQALCIYGNVEKYNFDSINREFQATLAKSLDRKIGSSEVTSWQRLATFMANSTWKAANPSTKLASPQQLVNHLNNPNQSLEKVSEWIDIITQKFCQVSQGRRIDPDLTRAILWTLVETQAPYAVKWLSGQEIAENKAKQLVLPNSVFGTENTESQAFEIVLQMLTLIADYKPILICFDELDTPDISRSKSGLSRPHVVARLIKSLVDSINLSETSQGIVILTVMMPDTWNQKIKQMPGGVPDRISATGSPINLKFMNEDSVVELVTLWLSKFYHSQNLKPPTPIYPFDEQKIRQLGKGNSVRKIIKWCAENFKVPDSIETDSSNSSTSPPNSELKNPVELAYKQKLEELEKSTNVWMEDETRIANSLKLCFNTIAGKVIDSVTVHKIELVEPKQENRGYIAFKIIAKDNGKIIKIGVVVMQKSSGRSVGAALTRLINYKKFDITRGCLIRSKQINPTAAQAQDYLSKLLSPKWGGEWVRLTAEDIKPLLAVYQVYRSRQDYQLNDQQIRNFIERNQLVVNNHLIREILSAPSGQIPTGLIEE
ncbi:hypothetical protein [Lyngbya sp. PCC 8106]|uniref:hypothetical protein n=1 Tax=Lyngbya sp. (strain PCC 8106) TaxID=313612 RepID=UPI0000EA9A49|nr:hypothetical protein [Lyngbya sp. PCC 8106]EAW34100.1 hypothetical protein L8106_25830 [Lyngbya sp. PCC 8106]